MSIQLQAAVPLLVTFVILAVIAVWRKYFKWETLIVGVAVLGLGVGLTVLHATAQPETGEESAAAADNTCVSLALAERYMLKGLFDEASDVLRDLQREDGGNPDVLLASARCALLRGDYAAAVQLYSRLDGCEEELRQAMLLQTGGTSGDDAAIRYLSDRGYAPEDYALTAGTGTGNFAAAADAVRSALKEHLESLEKKLGGEVMDAVKYAAEIADSFADYLAGDQVDVSAAVRKLEGAMKSGTDGNAHLRIARLKGYVLNGDYSKIAKAADRSASPQELVILAQLLADGRVNTKDFSQEYGNMDTTRYRQVLEICRSTLEKCRESLSREQYDRYKEKLELLQARMKEPVLFALRQDLLTQATEGAADMRSKSYLALAKLENADGSRKLAEEYIANAIGTAGDSDDENYRVPMDQMAGIIQGTAQSDEVKNVAQYVDAALDHSLPLDVTVTDLSGSTAEQSGGLRDQMTDTVTQSTATINIGVINKDDFPVVKARVQIQSNSWFTPEELAAHLQVYDCGSQITEFTLEKLEFQTSRIILLCDVSGSMDDSRQALKDAIISFADNMRPGEQVCVIGFNSGIEFIRDFSDDPDVVKGYADSVHTGGGTALFDSVLYAGAQIPYDINANNIIIAMTDGQDNTPAKEGDMYNRIGAMAADKGLTLYTLGLGSGVNTDYLTLMAQCGNGSFLYVRDQESLETFYDFIHGQLANQYILTYTAKNQSLNKRKLELSVEGELGGAEKTYYLVEPEHTNEGSDSYNPYTVEDTNITVSGLSAKFLYKSSQSQTLELRGEGFDKGDAITVRISGNVKYELKAEFVDNTTYRITVPAEVATGVYDLVLSIRGESLTLEEELTIAVAGDRKNFRFGSYSFTALKSSVNDRGETVLSGNVVMNGWLYFKGDVTIQPGSDSSAKAWLTDGSGAYISYSQSLATGLAGYLAKKGVPLSLGKLGTFCIYSDRYTPEDYEDFPVEPVDYTGDVNVLCLVMEDFSVSLYPDMARFQGINFHYALPFQKQLMRNLNIGGKTSGGVDTEALLTPARIALLAEVEYSGEHEFSMVSLPLKLSKATVKIDTLRGDYSVELGVKFKALPKMEEMECSFAVKDHRFDAIGLRATTARDLKLMDAPVPISMNNFGFELSGFSSSESDAELLDKVLGSTIAIQFDVNVASLNAYLPEIAKLIDDEPVALAQLADCKLSLCLKEFRLAFDAKLKLCTVLDLGKCRITLGKYQYTNALIGYYDETQYGLQAALTAELGWESPNLEMGLEGTAEVTLGYPYSGLWLKGDADFDVGWWILRKDFDVSGDILVGAYVNSSDNLQFSIIVRGTNTKGDYSGFHLYVTRPAGFNIKSY